MDHLQRALAVVCAIGRCPDAGVTTDDLALFMFGDTGDSHKEYRADQQNVARVIRQYLRPARIVQTVRGRHGGLRLTKPLSNLMVREVYEAVTARAQFFPGILPQFEVMATRAHEQFLVSLEYPVANLMRQASESVAS